MPAALGQRIPTRTYSGSPVSTRASLGTMSTLGDICFASCVCPLPSYFSNEPLHLLPVLPHLPQYQHFPCCHSCACTIESAIDLKQCDRVFGPSTTARPLVATKGQHPKGEGGMHSFRWSHLRSSNGGTCVDATISALRVLVTRRRWRAATSSHWNLGAQKV